MQKCCLDLISILISDDPKPGMENLDQVEIPPEVREQLDRDRDRGLCTGSGRDSNQKSTISTGNSTGTS